MPHLRTDAGVDLDLVRTDAGDVILVVALAIAVTDGTELEETFTGRTLPIELTPAEARMIGAYLNPLPIEAGGPRPVDGTELRARARAAVPFDPAKGMLPRNWSELASYARAMVSRGLEVAIVTPVTITELDDLLDHHGVTVVVDETIPPPGMFSVLRNGQRIATYHLGPNAAAGGR